MFSQRLILIICVASAWCLVSPAVARPSKPQYNFSTCSQHVLHYLHQLRGSEMKHLQRTLAHARIDFYEATMCLVHPPSTDEERKLSSEGYVALCKDRVGATSERLQAAEDALAEHTGNVIDHAPSVVATCRNAIASLDETQSEFSRVLSFFREVSNGVVLFFVESYVPAATELQRVNELRAESIQDILMRQKWRELQPVSAKPRHSGHQVKLRKTNANTSTLVRACGLIADIFHDITPPVVQDYLAMFSVLIGMVFVGGVLAIFLPFAVSYLFVVEVCGFFVKTILMDSVLRPMILELAAAEGSGTMNVMVRLAQRIFVAENALTIAWVTVVVAAVGVVIFVVCVIPAMVLFDFFQSPVVVHEKKADTAKHSATKEKKNK